MELGDCALDGQADGFDDEVRLAATPLGRSRETVSRAREQLVACGAPGVAQEGVTLRTPPTPLPPGQRSGRSKADARQIQRLQEQLAESRAHCSQLALQVETQQQKMQLAASAKRELAGVVAEMTEYLNANR